jgi:hypothetical protein
LRLSVEYWPFRDRAAIIVMANAKTNPTTKLFIIFYLTR